MSRNNKETLQTVGNDSQAQGRVNENIGGEPRYPILDKSEVWDGKTDLRAELPDEAQRELQPYEVVIAIDADPRKFAYPTIPLRAVDICTRAAGAPSPREIGYHGPTVASVNPNLDSQEKSRYEDQHGRDDLQAASDLDPMFPELLDTTAVSLAESQGVEDEVYTEGKPFGFEKPGAIILLNKGREDDVGRKFTKRKLWRYPFYGSVDATPSYINALATLHARDSSYLIRKTYNSRDGYNRIMSESFALAVEWLLEKSKENPQGLIAYRNPVEGGGGMMNQGWRDSAGAMVHADGQWANSKKGIAPTEVQGITYDAYRNSAVIFRDVFKDDLKASEMDDKAEELKNSVINNLWIPDERGGYFASGGDWDDEDNFRPLAVRTTAGLRLLRSELLKSDNPAVKAKVRENIRTLLSPETGMVTRWGLRTLAACESAYRPNGYHTGSTWPHDTNEVAASLANFGFHGLDRYVGRTVSNLLDAIGCFPEKVSGYDSETPQISRRDTYVYNKLYDETYLFEQIPPLAQTWAATSEEAKLFRYELEKSLHAKNEDDRQFEQEVLARLSS